MFLCLCLRKEGLFQVDSEVNSSLYSKKELIDWTNPLPGLKASMVPAAPTWENPPAILLEICVSELSERNSEAPCGDQWQLDQSALGITIIITRS